MVLLFHILSSLVIAEVADVLRMRISVEQSGILQRGLLLINWIVERYFEGYNIHGYLDYQVLWTLLNKQIRH